MELYPIKQLMNTNQPILPLVALEKNQVDEAPTPSTPPTNPPAKKTGRIQKIRQALQDWSNNDQQQQEFDDTQV